MRRGADRYQHCEKRMRNAAVAPVDENVSPTVEKHIPIVDFFVRQRFRQSGACQLLAEVYNSRLQIEQPLILLRRQTGLQADTEVVSVLHELSVQPWEHG